jgi:hypothetical protein
LLGHTKPESTVRYPEIEMDPAALKLAEQTKVWVILSIAAITMAAILPKAESQDCINLVRRTS